MTPNDEVHNPATCPLCGGGNDCQLCSLAAYKGPCWCARLSIPDALLAKVPLDSRNKTCICRDCVMRFHRVNDDPPKRVKVVASDFYFDNGLMVFTADYHLKRGYCCGNNCRHCPYQTAH